MTEKLPRIKAVKPGSDRTLDLTFDDGARMPVIWLGSLRGTRC